MRISLIYFPLLVIALVIVLSCNGIVDNDLGDTSNDDRLNVVTLRSNDLQEFDSLDFATCPSIEVLEDIEYKFFNSGYISEHLDSFLIDFDEIAFNAATIDIGSSEDYLVTLPLLTNGDLAGFMYFYVHNDHYHFHIIRKEDAMSIINSTDYINADFLLAYSLNKLNEYYYLYESSIDTSVLNWTNQYRVTHSIGFNSEYIAQPRDITIFTRWHIYTGSRNNLKYRHSDVLTKVIECDIVYYITVHSADANNGTGGGGYPTNPFGGPGTGSGINNNVILTQLNNNISPDDLNDDCGKYTFNSDVLEKFSEYVNAYNPCQIGESGIDILNQIVDELCQYHDAYSTISGGSVSGSLTDHIVTLEEFNNVAKNFDKIQVNNSFGANCPLANCVLAEMYDPNGSLGTDFICEILSYFESSSNDINNGTGYNLIFSSVPFSQHPSFSSQPNANAAVQVTGDGYNFGLKIYLNSEKCNNYSEIELFETLSHELVHADLKRRVFELGEWDGNQFTYQENFEKWVEQEYGPNATPNEHQIMLDILIGPMVNNLIAANGGVGEFEDFVGLIYNGFPESILESAGISVQDVENHLNQYNNFMANSDNISPVIQNSTLSECN